MEFIAMDLIGEFHPASSKGNRYALTAVYMLTGFTFCIPLKSKCTEDIMKAFIDHICCPFGPSKKILTDNGTEFKNKLWTDVFKKLRTEQKFTPIYSPQSNGRIKDFHKFLKATIAKQLETHIEWDDLVWQATAAYNFFPTDSSGMAPFFLMLRREAAVKHTLLHSKSSKYLGTDDGMINIELMNKLYLVVVHNLNQARKARDGNRKSRTVKEPEKLKIGDNVLVSDHTSKAFQPKYKDFCIIGLLGKNQVEVKDNHGHTTKVHHRDMKRIPMTEKICQLYEEEQMGKVREGRKAVPTHEMPELGWDIAESDIQTIPKTTQQDSQQTPHTLQIMITIAILIAAVLECIKTHIQKIPTLIRTMTKATKGASRRINNTRFIRNIRESYNKARLAVTIAMDTTSGTSRTTSTTNKQ